MYEEQFVRIIMWGLTIGIAKNTNSVFTVKVQPDGPIFMQNWKHMAMLIIQGTMPPKRNHFLREEYLKQDVQLSKSISLRLFAARVLQPKIVISL